MTNVIDTRTEPAVFDNKELTLSAKWIDWHVYGQMIQSPVDSLSVLNVEEIQEGQYKNAIKAGHEKLELMEKHIVAAMDDHCWGVMRADMGSLLEDLRGYLKTVKLIMGWKEEGYLSQIGLTDPSIFVGSPTEVAGVRDHMLAKAKELEIPSAQMKLYGGSVGEAITNITRGQVHADTRTPQLKSSVEGVPSLLWVLRIWADNPEMTYGDAHKHSVSLLTESGGEQLQ